MADATQREPNGELRVFFLHVMKTGGYSLATQMWKQFQQDQIYGSFGPAKTEFLTSTFLYVNPRPLAQIPRATIDRFRLFSAHFPYAARSCIGNDVLAMTVLRDPVERVISFLKHAQRYHNEHQGLSLEEIYEDPWYFTRFLDNHEVKLFSMTQDEMLRHSTADGWNEEGWSEDQQALLHHWREEPASLSDAERLEFHNLAVPVIGSAQGVYRLIGAPNTAEVEVDDARLRQAIESLAEVDVIGIFEQYDSFLRDASSYLGVELDGDLRRNVSERQEVSRSLRARIADQLGPSLELYEVARTLARDRAGARRHPNR